MMAGETSSWGFGPEEERISSGAGSDLPWEDWDELELDSFERDVCDAFELDDAERDPQPEYGDFWPEADEEDEV